MSRFKYVWKRIVSNKKVLVLTILFLFAILFSIIHLSYALFSVHTEKKGAFTLIVPDLTYQIDSVSFDSSQQLSIDPGMEQTIEVTITNPNEIASSFKLYYLGGNDGIEVFYVSSGSITDGIGSLSPNGSMTVDVIVKNSTSSRVTLTLGIQGGLLDQDIVLNQGRELKGIYADESGANRPVLVQGQIPVIYDSTNQVWVKADTSKKWYDYDQQEWANVVTVKETGTKTRSEYMNASAGTVIPMEDINTMWVWIPRYEYMYTNLGTNYAGGTQEYPLEIRVNFLNGTSITPSNSATYRVHPAFTFGDQQLEGIWFAKFEIATTDSTCNTNSSTTNCDKEMTQLQIKPNVISWENASQSTYFFSIRNMQLKYDSVYGISRSDSDIHMIKNSEWGSVAYLSQSRYGKFGNPNYEATEKEIRKNNCSTGLTGIGTDNQADDASSATCSTNTYETLKGMAASTTGNITGIYDMNGGRFETVMGVLADPSGNPRSGHSSSGSGFNGMLMDGSMYTEGFPFPDSKYYQVYTSTNLDSNDASPSLTGCNGGICYGEALSETMNYYQDDAVYIVPGWPWFLRGGQNNNDYPSGIFSFRNFWGAGWWIVSTRSVWVPF